jgi:hypothetical protein
MLEVMVIVGLDLTATKKMCEFTRFLASYVETLDETKVFRELWLGKWKNSKP